MKSQLNISRWIFFVGFVLLIFFGGGALTIVWLRMEISEVAKNCGKLEGEMEIVGREVYELRGQKSKSLRPSSLAIMVMDRLEMPAASRTHHISKKDLENRIKGRGQLVFRARGEFAGTR